MTLTIQIPDELQARLQREAALLGISESEYAKMILEKSQPVTISKSAQDMLDLLAKWDTEDYTTDPVEIARRQQDFEELKQALNRSCTESGGPKARLVFP